MRGRETCPRCSVQPIGTAFPRAFAMLFATLVLMIAGACVEEIDNPALELEAGAFSGDLKVVRRALAAGADVNTPSKSGSPRGEFSPIVVAASGIQSGFPDRDGVAILEELLRRGADPNARTPLGWTALMCVANSHNLEAVEILIEAGADVNAQAVDGKTALMGAVHVEDFDIVRRLLEAGADIDPEDSNRRTALSYARGSRNERLIRLLELGG